MEKIGYYSSQKNCSCVFLSLFVMFLAISEISSIPKNWLVSGSGSARSDSDLKMLRSSSVSSEIENAVLSASSRFK
jgi:hypothetical protein